jgi:hypothetical protein
MHVVHPAKRLAQVMRLLACGAPLAFEARAQDGVTTQCVSTDMPRAVSSSQTSTTSTSVSPGTSSTVTPGARTARTCQAETNDCPTDPEWRIPVGAIASAFLSPLCLDVVGADTYGSDRQSRGATVAAYACNTTPNRDLKWTAVDVIGPDGAPTGYVNIVNSLHGWCLDVSGQDLTSALGAAVGVYAVCGSDGADAGLDRQWKIEPGSRGFVLRNRANNLCLGLQGVDDAQNGTRAEVYTCPRQITSGADYGRDMVWSYGVPCN